MTSSERSKLRSIAMNLDPTLNIGKNGITDTLLNEIEEQLFNKEIIKISVLKNADFGAKDIIEDIAKEVEAEPVQAIGNKITLYKKSKKDGIKHIL